tara:strand:+ start:1198 stop:1380 length:183 start_codon:yes stop_codon:yes gene_type:complete
MAKSMKVPVLVIENIKETEILLEGLSKVPSEGGSHKKFLTENLMEEISKINSIIKMTNSN